MSRYDDLEDARAEFGYRRTPPDYACRCGMDAPGSCPGWRRCPCWQSDEASDDDSPGNMFVIDEPTGSDDPD